MKAFLWIVLALSVVVAMVWQYGPLKNAEDRITPVLSQLKGKEIPLSPFEGDFFKGVYLKKISVPTPHQLLAVFLIDATENRHVVHDPLYCYAGAGWKVTSSVELKIGKGVAKQVFIERDSVKKEFVYWFSDGKRAYHSFWLYWTASFLRRLSFGLSGSEPVLIMIDPQGKGPFDWEEIFASVSPLFAL
jgi:hypothetical protein